MKSAKRDIKGGAGTAPSGSFSARARAIDSERSCRAHARGGISRWNPDRLLRSAGVA